MQNLDKDFPLVEFQLCKSEQEDGLTQQDPSSGKWVKKVLQYEDCSICQEKMVSARKLQCNHTFHLFCIQQLIQYGYKNCPFCRQEIKHNHQTQNQGPQNRREQLENRRQQLLGRI
jgi:hypothetical protein